MNKKVWIGFIASYVAFAILGYIVNDVILMGTYQSLSSVWRPDIAQKLWIFWITGLFYSFFFSFIFSKGYEGKGIAEGVRYGLYIGLMMEIPAAFGQYAVYPVPHSLALQWFIYGLIENIIVGVVLAMVYGMKPKGAPAS